MDVDRVEVGGETWSARWRLVWRAACDAPEQLRRMMPWIAGSALFCALVIGGAYAISIIEGVSPADMTRDPLQTFHARFYIGMVSNLGVLLWIAAATACLCAGMVLHGRRDDRERSCFYLCVGGFTMLLALDDLFMFHEKIWPFVTKLPEVVVVVVYMGFAVWVVFRYLRILLEGPFVLMGVGAAAFSVAVFLDTFLEQNEMLVFIEDTFKFVGIVFWAVFFVLMAVGDLRRRLAGDGHPGPA